MASSIVLADDSGVATGSPSKGTTRTDPTTQWNWLSSTTVTDSRASAPVPVGTNSYERFRFAHITGTFTQLSNCLWAHTAGTFGSNIALVGVVTSTYTTPSTSANAALTQDMTSAISIASGQAVLFSTTGPEAAAPATTLSAAGYTQYLVTQAQVALGATAGDNSGITLSVQYDET